MSKTTLSPEEIEEFVDSIVQSKKYISMELPAETVRDLVLQELPRHKQAKQALQVVRKKIHNIVAPYLGEPDYQLTQEELDRAFSSADPQAVKELCYSILKQHASTKERLRIIDDFYPRIFEVTGTPHTILDLACAFHPFGLPWMNLPLSTAYYAYDLHKPRVELINHFFTLQNRPPFAIYQDILINPPQTEADVAFFFKEAHRFEQRQRGCNREFWKALRVEKLLVSLPTNSLSGKHDLSEQHRRLVYDTIEGLNWDVEEIPFDDELIFCIRK